MIWISHRGYHRDWIDNTKGAFDSAVLAGFQHLEADLRSTADGHIVLHHDASLQRTCDRNLAIETLRLSELRLQETRDRQKLLTFDEFIQTYAGCNWVFDIKPEAGVRTLHLLKAWAQRKKAESWLNAQARLQVRTRSCEAVARQIFPDIGRLASESATKRASWAVVLKVGSLSGIERGRTYSLPRYLWGIDLFKPDIIESFHRKGARVLAYLPATEADAVAALEAGCDEILTNGLPSLGSLKQVSG